MPGNGDITGGSCKVKFQITPTGATTPIWWYDLDEKYTGDITLKIDVTKAGVVTDDVANTVLATKKFTVVIGRQQNVHLDWK